MNEFSLNFAPSFVPAKPMEKERERGGGRRDPALLRFAVIEKRKGGGGGAAMKTLLFLGPALLFSLHGGGRKKGAFPSRPWAGPGTPKGPPAVNKPVLKVASLLHRVSQQGKKEGGFGN